MDDVRVLGVLTSDFALYHDVVRELKARKVPFRSLESGDDLPPHVGVLLVTRGSLPVGTDVPVVVVDPDHRGPVQAAGEGPEVHGDVREAVDAALRQLAGRVSFRKVVVGVDPGDRPGVAVLGDGDVLATFQGRDPEAVVPAIQRRLAPIPADAVVVRVGHGAATKRDRIINALRAAGLDVELVDETRTSPPSWKPDRERDITAAKRIALAEGAPVTEPRRVAPSEGELRDIQRRSRIASDGEVTIPRELARAVATGRVSLEEAVERQRRTLGDA